MIFSLTVKHPKEYSMLFITAKNKSMTAAE
jgi:hypothetical protein